MNTDSLNIAFKKPVLAALVAMPLVATPLASAQSPYVKPDGSWINLSGEVTATSPDAFTLDYGPGTVLVEMDDWDWYDESSNILKGDKVTVSGRVDDDLYETAKIEAASVFVQDLGTYFFTSAMDEESSGYETWTPMPTVYIGDITLTGTVQKVDGRTFTIDTGDREMRVTTTAMNYNPMDDDGFQKIEKGHRVRVTGDIAADTFSRREFVAESVITLDDNEDKSDNNRNNRSNNTSN